MKRHILIVEDDSKIRALLSRYLTDNNFIVTPVENTKLAELALKEFKLDLIVLDIMLPNETGVSFIKRIKNEIKIPVLMLSALGEVDDKIDALSSGAEDYMTKPFDPRELLLRINILISRYRQNEQDSFKFGDFEFEINTGRLLKNGELIHLTNNEQDLLKIFVQNKGKTLSREELISMFKNMNDRSIDAQISRLRAKIEVDHKKPLYLQTTRSKGYTFWG